jgi:hypothetical protein
MKKVCTIPLQKKITLENILLRERETDRQEARFVA